jgi:hypothetical protein
MWQKIKSQTNSNDSIRQLPEIKTGALFISFDHSLLFGSPRQTILLDFI